jgi:hypothetical protein
MQSMEEPLNIALYLGGIGTLIASCLVMCDLAACGSTVLASHCALGQMALSTKLLQTCHVTSSPTQTHGIGICAGLGCSSCEKLPRKS